MDLVGAMHLFVDSKRFLLPVARLGHCRWCWASTVTTRACNVFLPAGTKSGFASLC